MRRLFSTFASGAPGVGLLLLRAAAAASLAAPAVRMATGTPSDLGVVGSVLCAADGLLLAVGLPGRACSGLMLAAVTAALVMLGPGAWSVDARLFGWKRIEIAPRKDRDPTSE